jgi:shikimate kinase
MSPAENKPPVYVPERPILLLGMMGTGKTATGQIVADTLGWTFRDTDAIIVRTSGTEIPEIFNKYGEEQFRALETQALKEALETPNAVIASGGGSILSEQNRRMIQEKALSIWLDVAPETLWQRLKNDKTRPLLQTPDPQKTIAELYAARKPFYAQANIHHQIGSETAQQVAQALINLLSAPSKNVSFPRT